MEWIINSYDQRTDQDGEHRYTTEAAFMMAADHLLHDVSKGFESAVLPNGTVIKGEDALRAFIATKPAAR
jgi:hypothetical protein